MHNVLWCFVWFRQEQAPAAAEEPASQSEEKNSDPEPPVADQQTTSDEPAPNQQQQPINDKPDESAAPPAGQDATKPDSESTDHVSQTQQEEPTTEQVKEITQGVNLLTRYFLHSLLILSVNNGGGF